MVAQGKLQHRQAQALDQCLAFAALAHLALQLGQEQRQQFEGVAVRVGQGHAMPVHLPRLGQQDLPEVADAVRLGRAAAHPLQRSQHLVAP